MSCQNFDLRLLPIFLETFESSYKNLTYSLPIIENLFKGWPVLGILVQIQIRFRIRFWIPWSAPLTNGSGSSSGSGLNFLLKFCIKILWCRHYFSPLNTFMRKGKDPDPDPYIWLMDLEPDPGGLKTCGYCRYGFGFRIWISNTGTDH